MGRFCLLIALAACACTLLHAQEDARVEEKVDAVQQDVEVPSNIPQAIKDAIYRQLHSSQDDVLNGVLICALGAALVRNAEEVYSWAIVIALFILTYLVTFDGLPEGQQAGLRSFESFATAAIVGFAAKKSMSGVNLVLGATVGYVCAQKIEAIIIMEGYTVSQMGPLIVLLLYTAATFGGVMAFNSKYHIQLFAVLGSFVGGALLASGLVFLATEFLLTYGTASSSLVNPKGGCWIDFLEVLTNTSAADVGLFVGKDFSIGGAAMNWDQVTGWTLWAFFFLTSAGEQVRQLKASVKDREALVEPLLPQ